MSNLIHNYRHSESFSRIPNQPYSTTRYMFIHNNLLNKKRVLYTRGAINNDYIVPSLFDSFANVQLYYNYLNINHELILHNTLVYGVLPGFPANADSDYDNILYAKYDSKWYLFNANLVNFVLYRIPKEKRANVRYFFHKPNRVHTLVMYLDNTIIAVIAGLYADDSDIPPYLR